MGKMTATIDSDTPQYVTLELADGAEMLRKKISLRNYVEMLTSACIDGEKGIAIGKLPYGYYNASVRESGFDAIISIPAGVFPFQYYKDAYLLPFPRLVFCFRCRETKITMSRCYAAKEDVLTNQAQLFHYPYANVYPNGDICFGMNQLPQCLSISDTDRLVNLFYATPSNDDLWRKEYCGNRHSALRTFLEELHGTKQFPTELLLPNDMTVGNLTENFRI